MLLRANSAGSAPAMGIEYRVRSAITLPPTFTRIQFVTELLPLFAAANGNEGVQKFLAATTDEARAWVVELARRREEWQQQAEQTYELALTHLSVGDGIVFARARELSLRALGFCANRLKDKYQLPVIVMGWRGDAWVGEGRGVEGLNLMDVLAACSRFFIDYGGHKKAAGFSMKDEMVDEFIRAAEAYAHEHFAAKRVQVHAREAGEGGGLLTVGFCRCR